MEYYCLQGKMLKKDCTAVSCLLDRGLLYGEGLFETIKVSQGRLLFLEKHLKRLVNGCAVLGINVSREELLASLQETMQLNKITEGSLRLTVTGGEKTGDFSEPNPRGNYFITGQKGNLYSPTDYLQSYKGLISSIKRNPFSPVVYLKSLNFLENVLAKKEALIAGYQEALFLNTSGFLTEGSITNLFIVKDGKIFTPAVECGLLAGITREVVIDICKKNSNPAIEGHFLLTDLLEADEAFLTNSLLGIMPLTMVNNHLIADGKPGGITEKLRELLAYRLAEPNRK